MLPLPPPSRVHWVYEDPSGVPDLPLTVPGELRGPVEQAAASVGLSPSEWLTRMIRQSLRPSTIRAI